MLALELVPRLRPRSASPSPFPRSPSSLYRLMLAGDKACKPSRYRPPAFISTPHLLQRLPTDVSLFDAPAEGIAAHLDESLFREMYTSARQPCAYLEICLAHQCHTRPWRSTADHRRRNAHTAPVSPYSERPMFTHQPRQRQPIPKSSHGSLEVRGVNVRLEPLVAHGGVQVSKISSAPRRALAALTSISSVWRSAQFLLPHPIS